jgi:hypothetical protein
MQHRDLNLIPKKKTSTQEAQYLDLNPKDLITGTTTMQGPPDRSGGNTRTIAV